MENLKSGFKTIIITLAITFSLTGCTQIINVLDFIGVIPPWEQMLEFQLGKQAIEEPFTFADYCKEEYDSIFLVYPYFNIEKEDFVNYFGDVTQLESIRFIRQVGAWSWESITISSIYAE